MYMHVHMYISISLSLYIYIHITYGAPSPPPAFLDTPIGPNVWQSLAKLSDYMFPLPLWKHFGDHFGEEEKGGE